MGEEKSMRLGEIVLRAFYYAGMILFFGGLLCFLIRMFMFFPYTSDDETLLTYFITFLAGAFMTAIAGQWIDNLNGHTRY